MALTVHNPPDAHLTAEEVSAWRAIPTAVISDELNRACTMDAAIKPMVAGTTMSGQAMTVCVMVGDNAPLHYAVAMARPGTILVVDARGHENTAVWGGILTAAAVAARLGGVIIDGAVRDVAEIRESGLPVYARAVVPNGPHKGFGGTINGPVSCAGAAVNPGDLIVGDDDGIVVIRPEDRDGLMAGCKKRIAKEEDILRQIAAGKTTVELQGLPAPEDFA
ncbi:RraA family protein [Oceanibacterium hippocampi]|uniref:Putative 4-hydroxy-4-methyl-2-oxoglutarate aldolase n=1 Tax=Oceanibacterium hippocampi TaxID=745714 RepID=A0A1Y5SJR3_9PROT|nr:hypothetical protein [Oceanibacterium hippocampi]SLN42471.1 4-hydroxy-4-methyl-2-oxoglutarate aldolase [Oceanibacterium hippocampi]